MKLVSIKSSEYVNQTRTGYSSPMLSINGKSGVIAFNKKAIEHFILEPGQHIGIIKDEDQDPPEYYFKHIPEDKDEAFKLQKGTGRVSFSSKKLAHEIIMSVLKRKHPRNDKPEPNLEILVRFQLAIKPAMDGDTVIPVTYAIMGGTIIN